MTSDVEDLLGGSGNDTLTGNATANRLAGGTGDDTLDGGTGADDLDGGAGDDRLLARDGAPDALNCGAGLDSAIVDVDDEATGCEQVNRPAPFPLDGDGDRSPRPVDCDDGSAAVHPGAVDVPDNGIDEDCDGHDAINLDRDRDRSRRPADCDDGNAAVSPGAREVPGNAVDEDCDGVAEPLPRVTARLVYAFIAYPAQTRVVSLVLFDVAPATAVRVVCTGGGCPARRWTALRHAKGEGGSPRRRAAAAAAGRHG